MPSSKMLIFYRLWALGRPEGCPTPLALDLGGLRKTSVFIKTHPLLFGKLAAHSLVTKLKNSNTMTSVQ
jgi:hypothetical protein